jgi:hypothetical protein
MSILLIGFVRAFFPALTMWNFAIYSRPYFPLSISFWGKASTSTSMFAASSPALHTSSNFVDT